MSSFRVPTTLLQHFAIGRKKIGSRQRPRQTTDLRSSRFNLPPTYVTFDIANMPIHVVSCSQSIAMNLRYERGGSNLSVRLSVSSADKKMIRVYCVMSAVFFFKIGGSILQNRQLCSQGCALSFRLIKWLREKIPLI